MEIDVCLHMVPPTATHQKKRVRVVRGRPVFYEPPEVKAARSKLLAHVAKAAPPRPLEGPVALTVIWAFPAGGAHSDGDCHRQRPDLDNLMKLLLDCMTAARWWEDDAQVCDLHAAKVWSERPGVRIIAGEVNGDGAL